MSSSKNAGAILLFGLLMGILFDYLFYGRPLGINFPLYLCVGSVAVVLIAARREQRLSSEAWLAMLALVVFGLFNAWHTDGFLVFLNTIVVLFAGAILIATAHGESLRDYGPLRYLGLVGSPFIVLRSAFGLASRLGTGSRTTASGKWAPYLRGLVIALPLLIVFALLFASADSVFQDLIQHLLHLTITGETIFRTIEVLVVGAIVGGSLGRMFTETSSPIANRPARGWVGDTEILVVMALLNLLFVVFIIVQVRYLFGNQETVKALGITYAAYARQGFGQLIFSGVLSYLVIWATQRAINYSGAHKKPYVWLSGALLVEVAIILASAHKRLALYEAAYGFTVDRFWAHTIIFGLVLALALLAWKIWRNQPDGLFLRSMISLFVITLAIVNFINPATFVARQNISRYQETGKIDINYLMDMGEDAIPATGQLLESKTAEASALAQHYYGVAQTLNSPFYQPWQSYNLGREQAKRFLAAHQAILEKNKADTGTCGDQLLLPNKLPASSILSCIQPAAAAQSN